MRRMSSFMQGLRRISGPYSAETTPSFVPERASNAGRFRPAMDRDGSTSSRGGSGQHRTNDVLAAAELDVSALSSSPCDTLPYDHVKLDGLMNYHAGQLERIKREVIAQNETVEQLTYTLHDLRGHGDLEHTSECLHARIQSLRNSRNRLAKFVMFHLRELERIDEVKQVMREEQGQEHSGVSHRIASGMSCFHCEADDPNMKPPLRSQRREVFIQGTIPKRQPLYFGFVWEDKENVQGSTFPPLARGIRY
ncbi:predicted protein [Uncinocarpus reesii 1704]|uniref:Uncharacterized protein n=1 Tax=Uncinocarpus reesii (strain UAMH 1704) TaxID=336963 RepID=C4JYN9_UNCRE|nr:uncharacterized protein UREG_07290 [Uncinocarpus reesii 1704]EEP82425.1 predicted protein [Uncinocarpus reesii 1704]